jgi:glutamine synthetase
MGGKGYYEDRRPAANIDPYVVSASIFSVTCLNKLGFEDLKTHYHAFNKHRSGINNAFL